jgi:hypothetical protein
MSESREPRAVRNRRTQKLYPTAAPRTIRNKAAVLLVHRSSIVAVLELFAPAFFSAAAASVRG